MKEYSDQELYDLIRKKEDELWQEEDLCPDGRLFVLPTRLIMEDLGIHHGILPQDLYERISELQKKFYRPKDLADHGVHGGAFTFRGLAVMIHIPIRYEQNKKKPFELNDLNPVQRKWLMEDPIQSDAYMSTFCNLVDFSACFNWGETLLVGTTGSLVDGYDKPPESTRKYLNLAAFNLQAASATLCANLAIQGSIQSALMGAELALKAALRGKGLTEKCLRKNYSHNLDRLVEKVGQEYENFNTDVVLERCPNLQLVENRYSGEQPGRKETGKIVMDCQWIAGEVARALTGGSLQARLKILN